MKVGDQVIDDLTGKYAVIIADWEYPAWHSPGFIIEIDEVKETRFAWELTEEHQLAF